MRTCRIRTGRSLRGLCLSPAISRAERREVEATLSSILEGLNGDLAGKYYSLSAMTPEEEQRLIDVRLWLTSFHKIRVLVLQRILVLMTLDQLCIYNDHRIFQSFLR